MERSVRLRTACAATALWLLAAGPAAARGGASTAAPGAGAAAAAAIAGDGLTLEGQVEYRDLEGGFYTLDGWGLVGDDDLFKGLVGRRVTVRGREFTGMSIRMIRQLEVDSVTAPLAANRKLPAGITWAGKPVTFDQGPVVIETTLMVPLRAVVEAAGGRVEWVPREQAVLVTLPDRTATFVIGQPEAEMNEKGVFYFRRNLLPMVRPPVIRGNRTLVAADAVSSILGLVERADLDTSLDLIGPG